MSEQRIQHARDVIPGAEVGGVVDAPSAGQPGEISLPVTVEIAHLKLGERARDVISGAEVSGVVDAPSCTKPDVARYSDRSCSHAPSYG